MVQLSMKDDGEPYRIPLVLEGRIEPTVLQLNLSRCSFERFLIETVALLIADKQDVGIVNCAAEGVVASIGSRQLQNRQRDY